MKQETNKFATYLAIIAAPFALGAFFLTWAPSAQFASEDPAGDGYVPPRSIERLVERTQESTVTVWCEPADGKGSQGTGWAIELKTTQSKNYPTTLITTSGFALLISSRIPPPSYFSAMIENVMSFGQKRWSIT